MKEDATKSFRKRFLEDRDETGRLIVHMNDGTGQSYFVEFIGDGRMADWGSFNPSTGNIENKKGAGKFSGSVTEKDSMLTKENGYDGIIRPGGSYMWSITQKHEQWKKENGYIN